MTVFVVCAFALVALTLALLLPPLLRRHRPEAGHASAATNLGILQQQFAELQADAARGHIDTPHRQQAERELARRVLDETRAAAGTATSGAPATRTALLLCLALPVAAAALYQQVGNTDALTPPVPLAAEAGMDDVEQMVDRLAQRMASSPDDLTGWTMLARSLGALQRFPEASRAYSRAAELAPQDAQLLADYADVLAIAQGNDARGEPERLIACALKIAPDNLKALALAGSAAYARNDPVAAQTHWARALSLAQPGSAFALGLARSLDGLASGPGPSAAAPVANAATVAGQVTLAPALLAQVLPTDTVFIVARGIGADGVVQRMPLAVDRRSAGQWPIAFTLSDAMAMSPDAKLSGHAQVQVSVRVSRTGNAVPQPGDWSAPAVVVPVGSQALRLQVVPAAGSRP